MGRERERQRYLEDIPYNFSITHDVSDDGLCGVFHICGPRKDRMFCYDLNQYIVKGIMY